MDNCFLSIAFDKIHHFQTLKVTQNSTFLETHTKVFLLMMIINRGELTYSGLKKYKISFLTAIKSPMPQKIRYAKSLR